MATLYGHLSARELLEKKRKKQIEGMHGTYIGTSMYIITSWQISLTATDIVLSYNRMAYLVQNRLVLLLTWFLQSIRIVVTYLKRCKLVNAC